MRQASLYHHFANKDELRDSLLSGTVDEPLAVAQALRDSDARPEVKMYALALFDADQLGRSRWNLGALYLLPELRDDRFETFRGHRYALMDLYREIASSMLADKRLTAMPGAEDLPFRLVETVVNRRADIEAGHSAPHGDHARVIAESAVRVLGWSGELESVHARAVELVDEHARDGRILAR